MLDLPDRANCTNFSGGEGKNNGVLVECVVLSNDELKRNEGRPIFNISACLSSSSMVLIRYIQCTHKAALRHTSTVPTGNHMRWGVKCRLNLLSVFEFLNRP